MKTLLLLALFFVSINLASCSTLGVCNDDEKLQVSEVKWFIKLSNRNPDKTVSGRNEVTRKPLSVEPSDTPFILDEKYPFELSYQMGGILKFRINGMNLTSPTLTDAYRINMISLSVKTRRQRIARLLSMELEGHKIVSIIHSLLLLVSYLLCTVA